MTTNKFPFVVNLCSHSFKPSLLSINPKSPILQRQSGRKYPIFYPSQKKKQALPRPASCLYLCLFFYCNLLINVRNVAILESLILLGFKRFFRGICLYSCLYSCLFSSFLSVLKTLAIVLRRRTEQAAAPAPYRVIKIIQCLYCPGVLAPAKYHASPVPIGPPDGFTVHQFNLQCSRLKVPVDKLHHFVLLPGSHSPNGCAVPHSITPLVFPGIFHHNISFQELPFPVL